MHTVDICISVYVVCMHTVDTCVHWHGQRHSFLSHFLPSVGTLHVGGPRAFVSFLLEGGRRILCWLTLIRNHVACSVSEDSIRVKRASLRFLGQSWLQQSHIQQCHTNTQCNHSLVQDRQLSMQWGTHVHAHTSTHITHVHAHMHTPHTSTNNIACISLWEILPHCSLYTCLLHTLS